MNFRDRALEEATKSSNYGPYIRGEAALPKNPRTAHLMATFLFYLGMDAKAREVSYQASRFSEKRSRMNRVPSMAMERLFKAALFRDLSGKDSEAMELWQEFAAGVSELNEQQIIETSRAHIWVQQAYAFLKLKDYQKLEDPANMGLDGIEAGSATYDDPRKNSLEYALAPLVIALAEHLEEGSEEKRKEAQQALERYKHENTRYGRHGYPVIFDLQFSYPDVLDPVLPSDDPTKD